LAKQLISDEMLQASSIQLSNERFNSGLYLYIAGFLLGKGLDNLATIFTTQWVEENGHSKQIFDFLTDMNAIPLIKEVNDVNIPISSIKDIGDLFVSKEIETTESLEALKQLAIDDKNSIAEEFYRKMIVQQQKEMEESTTFADNADLCGDDWYKAKVWNDSYEVED
jgi:ferritin